MYKAQILSSTQLNSSGDTSTTVTNLRYIYNYCVHVNITAAANTSGPPTVKLQGSNDNSNWADISGTSNNITGTGTILINRVDDAFKYVKAVFTLGGSDDITVDVLITGREQKV